MGDHSEIYVAFDVAKVVAAESGRKGEVRYLGEIENTPEATRRLIAKLSKTYKRMSICYEAGPTGYGLFRWITDLGHECMVVAPSLIPSKPGDRVKTNRRDVESLAKLLRAGELTAVGVPDTRHEAMRDLVRAREAAAQDQTRKRQQVTSFLLRHGRTFPRKKTWGATHARWLCEQKFEHAEQRIAFEELVMAARQASERVARLEDAIAEFVPGWSPRQLDVRPAVALQRRTVEGIEHHENDAHRVLLGEVSPTSASSLDVDVALLGDACRILQIGFHKCRKCFWRAVDDEIHAVAGKCCSDLLVAERFLHDFGAEIDDRLRR